MSVISLPTGLRIATFSPGQARYDMLESSDATGHQATRLFGPPRWRVSMASHPNLSLAEAGQWEALKLQLRGGVNHLALHDPVRTMPLGTLRGSPVLNATAAAGATTLVLGKCSTPQNMLLTPSFEVDTDANGMADDWTLYDSGSAGTVTASPGTPNGGARGQRIGATALDVTSASQAGVSQIVPGIVPGQTYTLSVDELSFSNCTINMVLRWRDAGASVISSSAQTFASSTGGYVRRQFSAAAPALTASVQVFLTMHSNAVLGVGEVNFDNAQLEVGSSYTGQAPNPTLLAGDWLQVGTPGVATSQLVKVVASATATNNSLMTVTIEPPLRQQFTAASVVAWSKPLGYYKQVGDLQSSYGAGRTQGGFALDLLENWTP
jgi:hypothetical protein